MTYAGNTPFRRWKRRDLPRRNQRPVRRALAEGIKAKGEVRPEQYAHAIDMMPTVLEALGIDAPTAHQGATQSPMEGLSLRTLRQGDMRPQGT